MKFSFHNKIQITQGAEVNDTISDSESSGEEQDISSGTENTVREEESEEEMETGESTTAEGIRLPQLINMLSPGLIKTVKTVIMWLLYCLLVWKYNNHISDSAFCKLLLCLFHCFNCLGKATGIALMKAVIEVFPPTLYKLRKSLGLDKESYQMFIVCPKCYKVYDGFDTDYREQKFCNNVQYTTGKYSAPCGAMLLKEKVLSNGEIRYSASKVYCYQSIISSLEYLINRPEFLNQCEQWRRIPSRPEEYSDVYDGQIWKDFKSYGGNDFLNLPNNFALCLNIDWFQPFKRSNTSIGVAYLVVMNLPRHQRFKRKNTILLGVIPNLDKEPARLNEFLKPFVNELLVLWRGIRIGVSDKDLFIRAALLSSAADIPAARKICGFMAHNAKFGCSKCLKVFVTPGIGQKTDYSGFDKATWTERTHAGFVARVKKTLGAKSKTAREKAESENGCRYTELLRLPYYHAVRHHVIDPMHNLYLGTAKNLFCIWTDKDIITEENLKTIDDKLQQFSVPCDGRYPRKMSSCYRQFTAEEWMNWTLYFSLYVLKGILPDRHYKNWHTYVMACRLIATPVVSLQEAKVAELLFLKFGKEYQQIYGRERVTPNMHLHCHLADCIRDYGSIHSFWLFSFERYNGILSSMPTNKKDIEKQLMKEFTTHDLLINLENQLPRVDDSEFHKKIDKLLNNDGSSDDEDDLLTKLKLYRLQDANILDCYSVWSDLSGYHLSDINKTVGSLDNDELNLLTNVYQILYPGENITSSVLLRNYSKYQKVKFFDSTISAKGKHAKVMAYWCGQDVQISSDGPLRPGVVQYFMKHGIEINQKIIIHVFAVMKWFREFDEPHSYPSPLSVWFNNRYEHQAGTSTYLPVQRITCKYAYVKTKHSGRDVQIVCPLPRKL